MSERPFPTPPGERLPPGYSIQQAVPGPGANPIANILSTADAIVSDMYKGLASDPVIGSVVASVLPPPPAVAPTLPPAPTGGQIRFPRLPAFPIPGQPFGAPATSQEAVEQFRRGTTPFTPFA